MEPKNNPDPCFWSKAYYCQEDGGYWNEQVRCHLTTVIDSMRYTVISSNYVEVMIVPTERLFRTPQPTGDAA